MIEGGRVLVEGRGLRFAYAEGQPEVVRGASVAVVLTGRSPYTTRFRFETARDLDAARAALEAVDASHLETRPVT